MILLDPSKIQTDQNKIDLIDKIMKSVLRLVLFSRFHTADDVLDTYLNSLVELKNLVAIKNAQMEGQDEAEVEEYHVKLRTSLDFVAEEINRQINFDNELQLFQLLRLISPETNAKHPNKYRPIEVFIGGHICPSPSLVPGLMNELFYKANSIVNPIVRSIYFHHEMIRIHPFADGNGRVTRIAKNWILMYDLYPPIFIDDVSHKKRYISSLSNSFHNLLNFPNQWNENTSLFFEQQLDILLQSVSKLLEKVDNIGIKRIDNNE